jgi:hypothetical protein
MARSCPFNSMAPVPAIADMVAEHRRRSTITAMAHKLARLVYRMLKWGHEYVDKGLQYYEERHRQQQVQLLKKRAATLGLHIVEPQTA